MIPNKKNRADSRGKVVMHPRAIKAVIIDNSRQDDTLNVQIVGVAPERAIMMMTNAIAELRREIGG